jgi:hypothetical protein
MARGQPGWFAPRQFSKPVLDQTAGQDSVAELLADTVRTGAATAVATIAAGVKRAPSSVPAAAGSPLAVRVPQAAVAEAVLLTAARDQPNIGDVLFSSTQVGCILLSSSAAWAAEALQTSAAMIQGFMCKIVVAESNFGHLFARRCTHMGTW